MFVGYGDGIDVDVGAAVQFQVAAQQAEVVGIGLKGEHTSGGTDALAPDDREPANVCPDVEEHVAWAQEHDGEVYALNFIDGGIYQLAPPPPVNPAVARLAETFTGFDGPAFALVAGGDDDTIAGSEPASTTTGAGLPESGLIAGRYRIVRYIGGGLVRSVRAQRGRSCSVQLETPEASSKTDLHCEKVASDARP